MAGKKAAAIYVVAEGTEEFNAKMSRSAKSVRDFGAQAKGSLFELSAFAGAVGGVAGKISGMLTDALLDAIKTIADFEKIVKSTQASQDKFEKAMSQSSAALKLFHQNIATGNLSTFLSDLQQVTREAGELYDKLDNLGSLEMRSNFAIGMLEAQRDIYQLRVKDKALSDDERKSSMQQLDLYNKRIAAMRGELGAEKISAGVQTIQNELHANRRVIAGESNLNQQYNPYNILTSMASSLELTEQDVMDYAINGREYAQEALDAIEQYSHDMDVATKKYTETNDVYWKNIQNGLFEKFKREFSAFPERLIAIILDQVQDDADSTLAGAFNTILAGAQQKTAVAQARYQQNRSSGSVGSSSAKATETDAETLRLMMEMKKMSDYNDLMESYSDWDPRMFDDITSSAKDMSSEIKSIQESFDSLNQSIEMDFYKEIASSFQVIGNAIGGTEGAIVSLIGSLGQMTIAGVTTIANLRMQEAAHKKNMTAAAGEAAAEAMAAHSSIPFVGVAMGIGMTAMIIATLMSLPKFAHGGIVGGDSYHGDKVLARLNSGEGVLTRDGMKNLNSLVAGSGNMSGRVEFKIKDSELYGVLKQYNAKASRLA